MYQSKKLRYHAKELALIATLNKTIRGKLISDHAAYNGRKVMLKTVENHYDLHIPVGYLSGKTVGQAISKQIAGTKIEADSGSYVIQRGYIRNLSLGASIAEVRTFSSANFSKSKAYYHKLFLPLSKEIDLFFVVERAVFISDTGYRSANGTAVILEDEEILVGIVHDKKKNPWLVLESSKKQLPSLFEEKAHRIQLALSYFTAHYPGDKGYFCYYTNKNREQIKAFQVSELRESVYTSFKPVQEKPFGLKMTPDEIKKFQPHLKPVPIEQLSRLVSLLLTSADWTGILSLMMDSGSASLSLMPGGYAIALESLVNRMPKPPKGALLNKKDKQIFLKSCYAKLDELAIGKGEEEIDNLKILRSKIPHLLEKPNANRLSFPFEALGISLNQHDLEALKTRNSFLHGHIPDVTKAGPNRTFDRINSDLLYCSLRFLNLLNALILRTIGFKGYYCNYAKVHEVDTGIMLPDEDYYRAL